MSMASWIRRAIGPAVFFGVVMGISHTISAQFGHPLFAFVEIPILDNSGRPLVNGETGERITNGLCDARSWRQYFCKRDGKDPWY